MNEPSLKNSLAKGVGRQALNVNR